MEVLGSEEDDAEEESGDEPCRGGSESRERRGGMRASKAKGSAATPSKAAARSAEEIEEPRWK